MKTALVVARRTLVPTAGLDEPDAAHKKLTELHCDTELLLIETERQHVNDLFRSGKLKDEARRRIERELDLREAQIANRREEE